MSTYFAAPAYGTSAYRGLPVPESRRQIDSVGMLGLTHDVFRVGEARAGASSTVLSWLIADGRSGDWRSVRQPQSAGGVAPSETRRKYFHGFSYRNHMWPMGNRLGGL